MMRVIKRIIMAFLLVLAIMVLSLFVIISWPFVPKDEPWLDKYEESGLSSSIRIVSDNVPIDEQINVLSDLGYKVNPGMETLFLSRLVSPYGWPTTTLERYPYWLVFVALGGNDANEYDPSKYDPKAYYSNSTFGFSNAKYSEFIYVTALEQISRISNDELLVSNISTKKVGLNNRLVVSYELDGKLFKWSVPHSQRFNANLIAAISQYSINDAREKNLYWMHDEHGFHIVYRTYEEIERLRDITGINFLGLDDNQVPIF